MATIGFLHTAAAHVDTFDRLVAERGRGVASCSVVLPELLDLARRLGPDAVEVRSGVAAAIGDLVSAGAGVVVCTCSTIGATAVASLGDAGRDARSSAVPVLRVDAPMARAAVGPGRRIGVVVALESTVGPTTDLLAATADAAGVSIELDVLVASGAWDLFEAGDTDGYLAAIVTACAELEPRVDVMVLAQASMAAAVDRAAASGVTVPVLAAPALAVDAAMALVG